MNISANENLIALHDERFIWDERSATTVFTVFAVLACLGVFCGWLTVQSQEIHVWVGCSILIGFVFWFIGFVLMAMYCRELGINIKHDYYGPMRITGYTLREYTRTYSCGDSTCCERVVAADLRPDWGYAWACPAAPQTQCQKPIEGACTFKICGAAKCNDKKTEKATNKAIACAEEYFNSSMKYTAFEPESGPSQDENWPSLLAYGDCESCNARLSVWNVKKLKKTKIFGATFFFAGVALFLAVVASFVPWEGLISFLPSMRLPNLKPNVMAEEKVTEDWSGHFETTTNDTNSAATSL